jgi:hypothetical protein
MFNSFLASTRDIEIHVILPCYKALKIISIKFIRIKILISEETAIKYMFVECLWKPRPKSFISFFLINLGRTNESSWNTNRILRICRVK